MGKTGAIRAGRAYVEIYADSSLLIRGMRAAENRIRAFGQSVRTMGFALAAAGAVIAAPLLKAAAYTGNMAMELWKMSQRTGMSIEKLTALGDAARQLGVDSETLEKGIRFLFKNLYAAARGSKELKWAFDRLGLSEKELLSKSSDEKLLMMADAFMKIKDPAEKAALAIKIFGRGGLQLLPFLNAGAEKIRELMDEAARLGLVLSTKDVLAAIEYKKQLMTLWDVVKIGIFRIGSALIPTLKEMVQKMIKATQVTAEFVRQHKAIVVAALYVGIGLVAAGAAFIIFGTVIIGISKILGMFRLALIALKIILGLVFSPLGAIVAGGIMILQIFGKLYDVIDWVGQRFSSLQRDAQSAMEGISAALAGGNISLAAQILWLGLKMEWQKGTLALLKIWLDFKNLFLSYWYGIDEAIVLSWDTAVYYIKVAWIKLIAELKTLWSEFKEWYSTAVDWVAEKIIKIQYRNDPVLRDQMLDALHQDSAGRADSHAGDLAKIEADKKAAEDIARRQFENQQEQLGKSYGEDLKKLSPSEEALRKTEEELAKTTKAFNDSIAAAKSGKGETVGMPKMPDSVTGGMAAFAGAAATFGTFNKFALGQIGGGGVQERIAKAVEEVARNTRDNDMEFD